MKVYKMILSAALCLTTVNCKYSFSGEGEIVPPIGECKEYDGITPATSVASCISDLERTPTKMTYFDGGWFGVSPNYRLSLKLERNNGKVYAQVDTPTCKIDGAVSSEDYIRLSKLTSDVDVKLGDTQIIDIGSEYINIADEDGEEQLFLRLSDLSYKKPIVSDAKVAEDIRAQINMIADKVLANCGAGSSVVSAHLRENIQPITFAVDPEALRPHAKYSMTIQDLRVEHKVSGTRIYGYRTIVSPTKKCQTQIDSTVTSDKSWRDATAVIKIVHTDVICAVALGASVEDWRVVFPNHPKQLHTQFANGNKDSGFFGCQYGDRVENANELEALLNAALKAQTTVCAAHKVVD